MKCFLFNRYIVLVFWVLNIFALESCNNVGTSTFSGAAIQGTSSSAILEFGAWLIPTTNSGNVSVIRFTIMKARSGETVTVYTDSACATTPIGSSVATGNPVTATIVTNPLKIGTSQSFNLYAKGSRTTECRSLSETYAFSCPTGYIPVTGNSAVDAPEDFCVMKWEAKCATDLTGSSSCASATGAPSASKVAVSTAAGLPWSNISQTDAVVACANLNSLQSVTNRYDLLSNPEWMAIARDIEKTTTNWSGLAIGSGYLSVGRANSYPGPRSCDGLLQNASALDCAVLGSDSVYNRTHNLSNGQIIWDIPGNVWEWVDWAITPGLSGPPTSCNRGWLDMPSLPSFCPEYESKTYAPLFSPYNLGLGEVLTGSAGAAIRGGEWYDGSTYAGIYALMLTHSSAETIDEIGFRCVYRPEK